MSTPKAILARAATVRAPAPGDVPPSREEQNRRLQAGIARALGERWVARLTPPVKARKP